MLNKTSFVLCLQVYLQKLFCDICENKENCVKNEYYLFCFTKLELVTVYKVIYNKNVTYHSDPIRHCLKWQSAILNGGLLF